MERTWSFPVLELRRRTEARGNYTNPFQILVLCNAGDTTTSRDVDRVTVAYDSQHRPFWTDTQALANLALACLSSRPNLVTDERILKDMLLELKRRQFRNGTVANVSPRRAVLSNKSLLNVSSNHCRIAPETEAEALKKALDVNEETIAVQYSVWIGETKELVRTWRLKMRQNNSIYDVIETVARLNNRQKVE
ncbi:gastric intrinsic factor [Nephila pilipes]|uniref:Gastric intrinsic factor n=1 Tax=Nephila pilipes TaxID=299642 RepID=A0A8X6PUM9_NEPPI|nr:gastric intrinsic factor [Nephila pilipes]